MAELHVTDHAIVRFLERAGGMDVEALRGAIERSLARAHDAARTVSDSDYLVRVDGMTFVVRGAAVTTVLPDDHPAQHAAALRR
jgi:hypothetical protein